MMITTPSCDRLMRHVLRDVRDSVLVNAGFTYKLRYLGLNWYDIRVMRPGGQRSAFIEIIIDEYANPEDRGVRGAVMRYGDIPRAQIALIMDAIIERL